MRNNSSTCYLFIVFKLLNVLSRNVVRLLIFVHILSHIHHKIRWVNLHKYTSHEIMIHMIQQLLIPTSII